MDLKENTRMDLKELKENRQRVYAEFKQRILPRVAPCRKYIRNSMKVFLKSNRIAWMWNYYKADLL